MSLHCPLTSCLQLLSASPQDASPPRYELSPFPDTSGAHSMAPSPTLEPTAPNTAFGDEYLPALSTYQEKPLIVTVHMVTVHRRNEPTPPFCSNESFAGPHQLPSASSPTPPETPNSNEHHQQSLAEHVKQRGHAHYSSPQPLCCPERLKGLLSPSVLLQAVAPALWWADEQDTIAQDFPPALALKNFLLEASVFSAQQQYGRVSPLPHQTRKQKAFATLHLVSYHCQVLPWEENQDISALCTICLYIGRKIWSKFHEYNSFHTTEENKCTSVPPHLRANGELPASPSGSQLTPVPAGKIQQPETPRGLEAIPGNPSSANQRTGYLPPLAKFDHARS